MCHICWLNDQLVCAEDEGMIESSSHASQWPGLSPVLFEELRLGEGERAQLGSELVSRKASHTHQAVIDARDQALEVSSVLQIHCQLVTHCFC